MLAGELADAVGVVVLAAAALAPALAPELLLVIARWMAALVDAELDRREPGDRWIR